MALIKCPDCGQPMADNAKICPHCGSRTQHMKQGLCGCGCMVVLAILVWAFFAYMERR